MQNNYDFEELDERNQQLCTAIEREYGNLDPDDVDELARDFEESFTEMVEVIGIGPKHIRLMTLFYDEKEVSPVEVPKGILPHLEMKDVFLATLASDSCSAWHILYLSPPHESVEIDFGTEDNEH